ncbi:ribonuclease Z [Flavobacterium sp.]|uniref:ribonuclease Z n=1 Tax=Flavobacterium sp. TaxID=239 RepID=UPI003D112D73
MNLTILGCYAATPRTFTNPTSQVLEISDRLFLIDCGEGTQLQLRKNRIRFTAINQIFISHLHGDHFYGLIGLISTFSLLNRHNSLTIYGPVGIKEVIKLQLKLANSWPQYELKFVELKSKKSEVIFEDKRVIVKTIPLKHRVYTNGFLFVEKPKERKLNVDKVQEYEIETCYFQNIKNGRDITLEDGRVIPNAELSFDPPAPRSYAFCSDTVYTESIIPIIKDVEVLYHETTFLNSEEHLAEKTMHTTAKQAAMIAKKANVKQLVLGHYSTRYESIKAFKKEAEEIFDNVLLGDDGVVFNFK